MGLLDLIRCPACGGVLTELAARAASSRPLICGECEAVYPRVAGRPVLVANAAAYCARHRDALLATLALRGEATSEAVEALMRAGAGASDTLQESFALDWTQREVDPEAPGFWRTPRASGAALGQLLELAGGAESPVDFLVDHLAPEAKTILEVGPGSGALTAKLISSQNDRELLAVDRVFPALDGLASHYAVMEAEQPAIALGVFDAVVAANVVDLLDEPAAFLTEARDALVPGGQLLLSTPAPGLGIPEAPEVLATVLEELGFEVDAVEDGLPWVRELGPRELTVYLVQAIVAHVPED